MSTSFDETSAAASAAEIEVLMEGILTLFVRSDILEYLFFKDLLNLC